MAGGVHFVYGQNACFQIATAERRMVCDDTTDRRIRISVSRTGKDRKQRVALPPPRHRPAHENLNLAD
jgi:hypothetical protein